MTIHIFKSVGSGNNNPVPTLSIPNWNSYSYIYCNNSDTAASFSVEIDKCTGLIIGIESSSLGPGPAFADKLASLAGTKIVVITGSAIIGTLKVPNIAQDLKTDVGRVDSKLTDLEIFCQYVYRVSHLYPYLDIDGIIKLVQETSANGLSLAVFNSPPPPILPSVPVAPSGTITYPLFTNATGNKVQFDLKFFSQSNKPLLVSASEAVDWATVSNSRLNIDFGDKFQSGSSVSGVFIRPVIVTEADTKSNPPLQKNLRFEAMVVESITPSLPTGSTSVYPGIQGQQLSAKVKLKDLPTPLDINDPRFAKHLGTSGSLFKWTTNGPLLNITENGVLSVPENSLFSAGPFTEAISFNGLNVTTLNYLEDGKSLTIDGTSVEIPGYILGKDYRIHSTDPVVSLARLADSRIPENTPVSVSFKVRRDFASFVASSKSQNVSVQMNFTYGDFKLEAPLTFTVSPGVKWYPLFTTGFNMGGPITELNALSQTLTQVGSTLDQVRSVLEQVKGFVPLLGLFNFNNAPNALSILAGPLVDSLITIFSLGIYTAILTPTSSVTKAIMGDAADAAKETRLKTLATDVEFLKAQSVAGVNALVSAVKSTSNRSSYYEAQGPDISFSAADRDEWVKIITTGRFVSFSTVIKSYASAIATSDSVNKLLKLLREFGINVLVPEKIKNPSSGLFTSTYFENDPINHKIEAAYFEIIPEENVSRQSYRYFSTASAIAEDKKDPPKRTKYDAVLYAKLNSTASIK